MMKKVMSFGLDFLVTGGMAVVAVALVNQTGLRPYVLGEKRLIASA